MVQRLSFESAASGRFPRRPMRGEFWEAFRGAGTLSGVDVISGPWRLGLMDHRVEAFFARRLQLARLDPLRSAVLVFLSSVGWSCEHECHGPDYSDFGVKTDSDLVRATARLCQAAARSRFGVSVENPHGTLTWLMPEMITLRNSEGAQAVCLDQPPYDAKLPISESPLLKRSQVLSNITGLGGLQAPRCGGRVHERLAVGCFHEHEGRWGARISAHAKTPPRLRS